MAKYTAMDIANFYVQLANDLGDTIDNLKLNKLLYYAQGWSMVRFGEPLFADDIQAWDHGPVVRDVYHAFKVCRYSPIESPADLFDEDRLTSDELELLLDVYNGYGQYTGRKLEQMTHVPGSPWKERYIPGQNNIIQLDRIRDYFAANEKIDIFNAEALNIPIVTEAPAEWDSEEDRIYDTV